jgi:hypothetical protein
VIGNAVPPIFAWVVAKALEKHIENAKDVDGISSFEGLSELLKAKY